MAKAVVAVVALLCAALIAPACSPFGGVKAFTCTTDEDCSGGFCEADSLCSFTDATCELSGRRYGGLAGGQSNQCVGGETPDDAPIDVPVIPPEAGDMCYGDPAGLVRPCFAPANIPTGALTIDSPIDTTNDPRCSTTAINIGNVCVIAADSITISANTAVTGSRPLVLVAATTIQFDATLDASSHRGGTTGPAANDINCDPGVAATNSGVQGGGGAGGSFGTAGGNGGGAAATGGTAGAAQVPAAIRAGCAGQDGKEGGGAAGTRGLGGAGGGAVYLIAETSITIAGGGGGVRAAGAGATGGINQQAGGGGGGSGGMIVFDSPSVNNAGIVNANGGGGGEGSGNTNAGQAGSDPGAGITGGTAGAGGTTSGGDGGAGAAMANAGAVGIAGIGPPVSGGGGGGGVGVIRVFRGAIAGQISPAP